MNVSDLKEALYNPRKISDDQLVALKKSMFEFGDLSGVIVNVRTGRVVGGHQRIKGLDLAWPIKKEPCTDKVGTVALGYIETPSGRWQYREVDWPEKKEIAANLAANKHGGAFDIPKVKDLITEIDDGEFDLDLTGFLQPEIKIMFDFEVEKEEPGSGSGDVKKCPECGGKL